LLTALRLGRLLSLLLPVGMLLALLLERLLLLIAAHTLLLKRQIIIIVESREPRLRDRYDGQISSIRSLRIRGKGLQIPLADVDLFVRFSNHHVGRVARKFT
jgi:hypothetical protein